MTTTPDGISFSALQDMLADAPKEAEAPVVSEKDEQARLEEIADRCLTQASEEAKGPLVHKVMVAMVLSNLIAWHRKIGENLIEEGETETGLAWQRDAGKCQAILDILYNIQCGEDDFLVNETAKS